MTKITESTPDKEKKTRSKTKWREIETIRDRRQLMKELQEDDYSVELDFEALGL
jgi:hypothetical protein